MTDVRPAAVVVLAAGEGTRMKSATTPKVLHELCGRSMLGHVLAANRALEPADLVVVVGHARAQVDEHLAQVDPEARAVVQEPQNGTGHAVRVALDSLGGLEGTVVVVLGDAPLLRAETLQQLVAGHVANGAATTLLSARFDDPTGYGRVVRDESGDVAAIVEHKDADEQTRAVTEINVGVYAFDAGHLRDALSRLTTANAQGEEYLTDVVALHRAAGLTVAAQVVEDAVETTGVNDRVQLSQARRVLRDRIVERHQRAGVTVIDPQTTWIDVDVRIEPDVTVHPGTQLHGRTILAAGAVVGPDTTLTDTEVGRGARVLRAHCDGAVIGPEATVGPFTYLRPGTRLGRGSKAGAYVEIKASDIGEGSKVPHLSYVGDAVVGERSNIGAATVAVNYDGRDKHRTTVGDDVRIGSDTMLVAPVSVGDGAYTAAGSVITADVPAGALGVGRARQRNIDGWVARKRSPRANDGEHE
ncbi:MAG: bifunctional UDP-N-acetylglucosamine diphosphorylase/glucosamine-1-phosphate N-acetyltransferase GlmU [Actinomycetota bacterium]|nr:bifunctional UDP-N-acetylglucosamine diphosphorylase/glucosamine-1-phosphate N-acetyltransferase GlmU [Actinomycetota bacterium]